MIWSLTFIQYTYYLWKLNGFNWDLWILAVSQQWEKTQVLSSLPSFTFKYTTDIYIDTIDTHYIEKSNKLEIISVLKCNT